MHRKLDILCIVPVGAVCVNLNVRIRPSGVQPTMPLFLSPGESESLRIYNERVGVLLRANDGSFARLTRNGEHRVLHAFLFLPVFCFPTSFCPPLFC